MWNFKSWVDWVYFQNPDQKMKYVRIIFRILIVFTATQNDIKFIGFLYREERQYHIRICSYEEPLLKDFACNYFRRDILRFCYGLLLLFTILLV